MKDLVIYNSPYPDDIFIGQKFNQPELLSNIPQGFLSRDAIGIVLGNTSFLDSTIQVKSSTSNNVEQVREYFYQFFGMEDHEIVPSQYWLYNNGISSNDFRSIFDPGLGFVKNKIISNLEYSFKDTVDLLIYFSGEGTTINGEKVLLPSDADESKSTSFYPVKDLYTKI
tara:strand:- start:164 stop:670 length:507 start_codon:yes stop_codon:yes gene_type:complete